MIPAAPLAVSSMHYLPSHADTVVILANPKAGPRAARPTAERLADSLRQRGQHVALVHSPDELTEAVASAQDSGRLRAVVAAGGDGTAALAANLTSPETPLAVLALGTENLLVRYLRLPSDPAALAELIVQGATTHLDAGSANNRLFILMTGVGFDADVVRRLHQARTGHIRHLSYIKPILDSVRSYSYPRLRVYCQPTEADALAADPLEARWAFVVNLPQYAGGLRIAPQALPADGKLDVCTFRHGSWFHGLRYLAGIALGRHERWSEFRWETCVKVRIEADGPASYQLDGDPGGDLPVDIEVLPRRLRLLVAADWRPQNHG